MTTVEDTEDRCRQPSAGLGQVGLRRVGLPVPVSNDVQPVKGPIEAFARQDPVLVENVFLLRVRAIVRRPLRDEREYIDQRRLCVPG